MRVAFLHPELGPGGAERLVVDAASSLAASGHRVAVFTSRRNPARAFAATADLDVRVHGTRVPVHLFQRLRAPSAVARMAWLAQVATREEWDVVFCDLVAHVVPFARRWSRAPVIFYCHFPDRLLAPPGGPLYRLYRAPIERLEERGFAAADRVLVNSRYTAESLRRAFPRLAREPTVLHPGVDLLPGAEPEPIILTIGRFDPVKNLGLAVETLAVLRTRLPAATFAPLRLVVAGAFDPRLAEQHRTVAALGDLTRRHGLADRVEIVRSPDDGALRALLSRCLCVLYTPEREHFGYVPLEAMAAGRPVIAAATGGPAETVVDGETGWLRPPTAAAFAEALECVVRDPATAARMGARGREHVAANFSRETFGRRLGAIVADVVTLR